MPGIPVLVATRSAGRADCCPPRGPRLRPLERPPPPRGHGPAGTPAAAPAATDDVAQAAAGFDKLFLHDPCTGRTASRHLRPRTPAREIVHVRGNAGSLDVTLHHPRHLRADDDQRTARRPTPTIPYFKVGGTVRRTTGRTGTSRCPSRSRRTGSTTIRKFSHTIYKEDYEATIPVAAGATVVVRVIDGNDRQIDNGTTGRPDRQQTIAGVADTPLEGSDVASGRGPRQSALTSHLQHQAAEPGGVADAQHGRRPEPVRAL